MTKTILKPYSDYQAAELRWLDRVPAHWDVQRAKTVFRPINVRSETGKEELLTVSSKDGVRRRSDKKVTMFQAASYVGHKLCWPGDLVVNSLWAWAKGLGVSRHHGIVSTAYSVYRPRPKYACFADYFHSLLRSEAYDWEFSVRSKGIWISRLQLTDSSFFDMPVILPPAEEAEQIGRFIRDFDQRVNRLIRAKRRLVALLTEQKQAVIQRAVTRGLDPDAPTKPSGVDWLGDVPEHWNQIYLGSSLRIVNGYPFDSGRFTSGEGHKLVRIRDMSSVDTAVRYSGPEVAAALIDTGDVLVGMDGDFNVARWRGGRALLNQRVCCLRPKSDVTRSFLSYVLPIPLKRINDQMFATTVKHLSSSDIKHLRFHVPPLPEQDQIVAYVEAQVGQLDRVIGEAQAEITLIQEYRQRLVADVVTGKLDVRGVAVPDSIDNDRQRDEPDDDLTLGDLDPALDDA